VIAGVPPRESMSPVPQSPSLNTKGSEQCQLFNHPAPPLAASPKLHHEPRLLHFSITQRPLQPSEEILANRASSVAVHPLLKARGASTTSYFYPLGDDQAVIGDSCTHSQLLLWAYS